MLCLYIFAMVLLTVVAALLLLGPSLAEEQTCSWNDASCYRDPHLKEITVDLGRGSDETFLAYHPPDLATFYQQEPGTRKPMKPTFDGQFGKFINMSPETVRIYWDAGAGREPVYLAEAAPFEATAAAMYPGNHFLVRSKKDLSKNVHQWTVKASQLLSTYDPFVDGVLKLTDLSPSELEKYNLQLDNLKFAAQYKAATGIDYLSLYPMRRRPINPMWPADYFGQEHSFLTRETHFTELPTPENLVPVFPGPNHEPMLKAYRGKEDVMNMTMKVLSCSPRVFEIRNFLSKVEIDHVMKLATGLTLHQSSTKAGSDSESRLDEETRTSRNSWVQRGKSPIVDAIYRRSADAMQIDEAYLRTRKHGEMPHVNGSHANAEYLQLVHYDVGQQYTPHHDFSIPALIDGQPMRFATILLYLNEGMQGGETTFPRWLNAESSEELTVVPEVGKAVLFYNLLPDGNMDERSQHSAKPVKEGEKWLINVWTWDPIMSF